jgi:excisionase family DNA binding protein
VSATLTPEDVATAWKVHPKTVQRLCAAGKLRAFRVGDLWRIPAKAVAEYEAGPAATEKASGDAPSVPATRRETPVEIETEIYIPIAKGPVPWRSEVIDETQPNRAVNKQRARASGN